MRIPARVTVMHRIACLFLLILPAIAVAQPKPNSGGIMWYATLESGFAEAKRTDRPILFLSAAPHCGGVSGMW